MAFILDQHNSLANTFISELRDNSIQKDSMRFRRNLERIGEVLAYEISKTLNYKTTNVETPMGIAEMNLPDDRVVLATIMRAGLPMHQGFLNYFDQSENAFLSAYRKHHKDGTFEIKLDYISCPNLDNCHLIVVDPMLATGASMNIGIKALLEHGTPKQLHIASVVCSTYGYEYLKRLYPEAKFWLAAIDEELTARSYIVPGLGDAGDLAFGTKLQD